MNECKQEFLTVCRPEGRRKSGKEGGDPTTKQRSTFHPNENPRRRRLGGKRERRVLDLPTTVTLTPNTPELTKKQNYTQLLIPFLY